MSKSRPYRIRRLALQVELDTGEIMTFYADPRNADGAQVIIDTETPEPVWHGYWAPLAQRTPAPPEITITVGKLAGYVMTLRHPEDLNHDPIDQARKGIEQ